MKEVRAMTEKTEYALVVTTTFEDKQQAGDMAAVLLKERLIACAQISGPITSTYWWKDEIITSTEFLLSMKTLSGHYEQIEKAIKAKHSYEVPEIIGVSISEISDDYRQWLKKELGR
jgi:periplasmic divalent cation tolerance protein